MRFTQRQVDRICTTIFCGLCAAFVGLVVLWAGGNPWITIPIVALYGAWGATGFDISRR